MADLSKAERFKLIDKALDAVAEATKAIEPDAHARLATANSLRNDLEFLRRSLDSAPAEEFWSVPDSEYGRLQDLARQFDAANRRFLGPGISSVDEIFSAGRAVANILGQSVGGRPGNYRCTDCGLAGSESGTICRACGGLVV